MADNPMLKFVGTGQAYPDKRAPDVRAGFSSVIAAAAAEGRSVLRGVHHLERGYHRPADQLRSLGLDLQTT